MRSFWMQATDVNKQQNCVRLNKYIAFYFEKLNADHWNTLSNAPK